MIEDRSFMSELKRRKVHRTAAWYIGATLALWGGLQVASDAFAWPTSVLQMAIAISVFGFPVAVTGAWMFDVWSDDGSAVPRASSRVMGAVAVSGIAGLVLISVLLSGGPAIEAAGNEQPLMILAQFRTGRGLDAEGHRFAEATNEHLRRRLANSREVRSRSIARLTLGRPGWTKYRPRRTALESTPS
jgi:hypothetical protein